jgi:hypothetical protein
MTCTRITRDLEEPLGAATQPSSRLRHAYQPIRIAGF